MSGQKKVQERIWTEFIQSEVKDKFKEAQKELNKLNADNLKFVTPHKLGFDKEHILKY